MKPQKKKLRTNKTLVSKRRHQKHTELKCFFSLLTDLYNENLMNIFWAWRIFHTTQYVHHSYKTTISQYKVGAVDGPKSSHNHNRDHREGSTQIHIKQILCASRRRFKNSCIEIRLSKKLTLKDKGIWCGFGCVSDNYWRIVNWNDLTNSSQRLTAFFELSVFQVVYNCTIYYYPL